MDLNTRCLGDVSRSWSRDVLTPGPGRVSLPTQCRCLCTQSFILLQRCAAITGVNTHPLHNAMQKPVMAKLGLLPRHSLLQKCCSLTHCRDEELLSGALLGAGHANSAERHLSPTSPSHQLSQWMDVDTEAKARVWALLDASIARPLPDLLSAG